MKYAGGRMMNMYDIQTELEKAVILSQLSSASYRYDVKGMGRIQIKNHDVKILTHKGLTKKITCNNIDRRARELVL